MKRYEQFEHTADIGLRIFGSSLKELFENAAFAVFDTACDIDGIKGGLERRINLRAENLEELFLVWLDELLYLFFTKSIIFYKFAVSEITEKHVVAVVVGRDVGLNRNRLKLEIKGVTYGGLSIKKTDRGYVAEVIIDV